MARLPTTSRGLVLGISTGIYFGYALYDSVAAELRARDAQLAYRTYESRKQLELGLPRELRDESVRC
ncbi:hypothetical protein IWQ60_001444 [Tieghemiomyces parasiticus]|uniref:Uncharacterized protein n=1 Tax=Tieghemiomyces parasiticus TaxID=78921 RepID=A0A9W8E1X7_9FUNG|nr:hypothetical protein IWQ60_001444 [Tieghemiomyces parasiticus]